MGDAASPFPPKSSVQRPTRRPTPACYLFPALEDVPIEGTHVADDALALNMGVQAIPAARQFHSEEHLALALAEMDTRAWRQLFEEQYQRVYNYAYLRTGNTADADDIASNVFTEAVRGIRRFNYRGKPVAAWASHPPQSGDRPERRQDAG